MHPNVVDMWWHCAADASRESIAGHSGTKASGIVVTGKLPPHDRPAAAQMELHDVDVVEAMTKVHWSLSTAPPLLPLPPPMVP